MKNISKLELISNLQDKISQFKSNFSKIKESRKEVPELNFEINRDALKMFYKKKADTESQLQGKNPISSKQEPRKDEENNIQSIFNDKNNHISNINQNLKCKDKNTNQNEKGENDKDVGAKIKKSHTFESNSLYNNNVINKNELNNVNNNITNNLSNNIYNISANRNFEINNKDNLNIIGHAENNSKDNAFKKPEINKNYNILENLEINTAKNLQFNVDGIQNNKKLEKREKSAPKITINQKINNFYSEKPLTDKKHDNIKNINTTSNYNQLFNINNNKRTTNTEDLYQKLLMNFNIKSSNNKKDKTFYNFNISNNNKLNREDNPNKSYGQINLRDTNSLYELNGNTNYNYYNLQKRNYYRNGLNLDNLKDLYPKKTEDSKRPTHSMFKSKMDMFYQELNEYKNANYNKKKELKNYYKKSKYIYNNNFVANTQYNDYIKNNNNLNINNYPNIKNDNNNITKNNVFNGNKIGYNEIASIKKYLNDLSKDEINKLPIEIKNELKDIFNILYQKLTM